MAGNKALSGPVPESPHVVTASPAVGGPPQQDWDSTSEATMEGWKSLANGSGPADLTGQVTGGFEDGPGRWQQT